MNSLVPGSLDGIQKLDHRTALTCCPTSGAGARARWDRVSLRSDGGKKSPRNKSHKKIKTCFLRRFYFPKILASFPMFSLKI